ncbi:MAG: OsmC family peroxiredoxin [Chloroflexi bacterium]|nr:OsmC family peroxiredoxin [Chloroflexota bacterium]MCL5026204.1 OsmC family peroxiredoxin [Chloroflexota bacterium]
MAAIRRADVVWQGDLMKGSGVVSAGTSHLFTDLPVTWASRTEEANGRTSPEELLAAAHASCFSMALSNGLTQAGHPPERLETTAEVTFDRVDGSWRVVSSALRVRGWVPNIDAAAFQQAAERAKDMCPVSQALKNNVALSVEATLESTARRPVA